MDDFEKQLSELMRKIHEGNGQVPYTLYTLRTKGVVICSETDACAAGTRVEVEVPGFPSRVFVTNNGSEGADTDDGGTLYYTRFYLGRGAL